MFTPGIMQDINTAKALVKEAIGCYPALKTSTVCRMATGRQDLIARLQTGRITLANLSRAIEDLRKFIAAAEAAKRG